MTDINELDQIEYDIMNLSDREFQEKYRLSDEVMCQIRMGPGAEDIDGWE